MDWLRWIGWWFLIFLFNKRSILVICLYFTRLSLSDLLHFAQLVFCLWSLPLMDCLLYKLRSMEEVHPKQFPNPKRNFQAERQVGFRRMIFFMSCFLNNEGNTCVTWSKMVEFPSRRDHLRHMSTWTRNDGYLGNMWTEIEYKRMKPSSKSNGGSNTKYDPVECEQDKSLNRLNK